MELYREIYKLKNLKRRGWILRSVCDKETGRVESDAEHTFSMAILALEIMEKEKLNLDTAKVLKMILYHEICEIDAGDHTPVDNITIKEKYEMEKKGIERISETYNMPEIKSLWLEFEENKTAEARFVKMVDKLDAIMQSKIYSENLSRPELFEEFYSTSQNRIKGYEKYLK